MKHHRMTIVSVCASCVLAGCAGVIMPNSWEFHKGNLTAAASTNVFGTSPRYSVIKIGTPEKPFYKLAPRFAIKLSDGRVLLSNELTLESVLRIAPDSYPATEPLPKSAVVYQTPGYMFVFLNSDLIQFEALNREYKAGISYVPEIGTYDKAHFHKIPLSHQQLIEIFGAPDVVKKDWCM